MIKRFSIKTTAPTAFVFTSCPAIKHHDINKVISMGYRVKNNSFEKTGVAF